jgi:hypothetical protein
MSDVVTPAQIERRLKDLSNAVDDAHNELVQTETDYHNIKAKYELAMAKSRILLASKSAPNGKNYTVGEREDMAIVENEALHRTMASVEALVKASRANTNRLKVQVEITRSIGTSVRTSLDLA